MKIITTTKGARRRLLVAVGAALAINAAFAVALVGIGGPPSADAAPSPATIRMEDDCDPATFNAALGPDACVGDGTTTLSQMFAQLGADGDAPKWRFTRERVKVAHGRHIVVPNRGGEFHTFTKVAAFSGGCIPALNQPLGLEPVAECADEIAPGVPRAFVTSGVASGGSIHVTGLRKGTHRFECLIHPWMRSTVVVR